MRIFGADWYNVLTGASMTRTMPVTQTDRRQDPPIEKLIHATQKHGGCACYTNWP